MWKESAAEVAAGFVKELLSFTIRCIVAFVLLIVLGVALVIRKIFWFICVCGFFLVAVFLLAALAHQPGALASASKALVGAFFAFTGMSAITVLVDRGGLKRQLP